MRSIPAPWTRNEWKNGGHIIFQNIGNISLGVKRCCLDRTRSKSNEAGDCVSKISIDPSMWLLPLIHLQEMQSWTQNTLHKHTHTQIHRRIDILKMGVYCVCVCGKRTYVYAKYPVSEIDCKCQSTKSIAQFGMWIDWRIGGGGAVYFLSQPNTRNSILD